MRIGKRLEKVLELIDNNSDCILDIGTDHGYLAFKAITQKNAKMVVASDISLGSLKKAEELAKKYNLTGKFKCVLSDGFKNISKSIKANAVIIAGMGGIETAKILKEESNLNRFNCFILQPMQDAHILREYLFKNGFQILIDETVKDRGKYYHVIKCIFTGVQKKYELKDLIIGRTDRINKSADFIEFVQHEIKTLKSRFQYLKTADYDKLAIYTAILGE